MWYSWCPVHILTRSLEPEPLKWTDCSDLCFKLHTQTFHRVTQKAGPSALPRPPCMEREDYVFTTHLLQSLTSKYIWTIWQRLQFVFGTISSELICCPVSFSHIQSAIAHHVYLLCKYNKSRFESCGKRDLSTGKVVPWSLKRSIIFVAHLILAIRTQLPVGSMSLTVTNSHRFHMADFKPHQYYMFIPFLGSSSLSCGQLGAVNWKHWKQRSTLYLLEVAPVLATGDILQGLYGHKLRLVHARQIQVTLVDLPQRALSELLHETHSRQRKLFGLALRREEGRKWDQWVDGCDSKIRSLFSLSGHYYFLPIIVVWKREMLTWSLCWGF